MWYGWTGTELEVDLSTGKIKKSEASRDMYEKYLSGRGAITRHFWDRVPPETDPFSPESLLIFGVGPLVATAAPASCRTSVVFKSAMTNCLTTAGMAGFWGPELKLAGYDDLIISGKSSTPVYIYINSDKVEVRDASHLWGQDAFHTQQSLREELNDNNIQTLAIGPAGENKVFFASIEHGPGSSMSRGPGAIMGDKKLKAIAVRGNKNVNIARPAEFFETCEEIMRQSAFNAVELTARWPDENGKMFYNIYPHVPVRTYRNFDTPRKWEGDNESYLDFLLAHKGAMASCYNCQQECIHELQMTNGEPIYWNCGIRFVFTCAGDVQDWDYNLRCSSLLQRLGMDSRSATNVCRFAIDAYQKGILTKEDTGGQVLDWGNPETCPTLLEKIAYRKDIGNVLANGGYQAALQIGPEAEKLVYHFRKLDPSQGDSRTKDVKRIIRKLIADRQGDYQSWDSGYDIYDKYLQGLKGEEAQKWKEYLDTLPQDKAGTEKEGRVMRDETQISDELLSKALAFDFENLVFRDLTGLCQHRFNHDDNLKDIGGIAFEAALISHATGLDMDEDEARERARRVRFLHHSYNAILGERENALELDPRSLPPNLQADNRAFLNQLLARTNRIMGFSPDGIPLKESLKELGMSDVAQELKRRGILPEEVAIPK